MFPTSRLELVKFKSLKKDYKLVSGNTTVGSITFKKSSGTLAEAGIGDHCWSFKRVGFFSTKITIRNCGDKNDLAIFINNTWKGGGTLHFKSGITYKADTNFWNSEFSIQSPRGKKIAKIITKGIIRSTTSIEISKGGEEDPMIELIVLFACYLLIMIREDEVAATSMAMIG
jgi:hypothetical protein